MDRQYEDRWILASPVEVLRDVLERLDGRVAAHDDRRDANTLLCEMCRLRRALRWYLRRASARR